MPSQSKAGQNVPLIFVFLGGELPSYAEASLRFASSNYSGQVVLLSDTLDSDSNADFHTLDIRPWYDRNLFGKFRAKSSLDGEFRGGFWLHAVERFFVLEQFMAHRGLDRIFHAELDVMVFDLDGVSQACDSHGSGIFSVMDSPNRSLASLFYVNSRGTFRHFLEFLLDAPTTRNEMQLLGEYTRANPTQGHALPSEIALDATHCPVAPSSVSPEIGIFDAAALGQWLFGIDSRNTAGSVWNHFKNPNLTFPIQKARFSMSWPGLTPTVSYQGVERRVRTLHIHSKIVERLVRPLRLRLWVLMSSLPFPVLVQKKRGILRGVLLRRLLVGRGLVLLRGVGSLLPRWTSSVVSHLRETSAQPLSNRQAEAIESIFRNSDPERNSRVSAPRPRTPH